jgi:iron complex outermembrane receptor protein
MKCSRWSRLILRLAASGACALLIGISAQAQSQTKSFDIAGGDLKFALDAYLAQAGVQLIYKVDDIKGLSTKGVKGALTPDAALAKLLEGTRLRVRHGADGAMVIVLVPAEGAALKNHAGSSIDGSGMNSNVTSPF